MGTDRGVEDQEGGTAMRSASAFALAVVIAAAMVAGWLVFVKLVLLHRQPSWDEATHILQGALIAHDLRSLDLLGFLFDSYRQVYWPPLHSWLVGAAFLLAQPSLEVARAVSVLAYVLLAPTLFIVARFVEPRGGILAGSLAAALALTSPAFIELAARSMLELPGLLALSCTMLVYCRLERTSDGPPREHALLGVGTVVTYLIKSNYGLLLVICVVLSKLIAARFRLRQLLTRQNLYAVLPVAIFCAIWFAYPPKLISTWNALVNQPYGGEGTRGVAGLLFYPRIHISLSGSWWMSLLLWSGLAMAWSLRDRPGIRFLAVLALTPFVIGEFHHTKVYRHILPMYSPMFVLTGVMGTRLWTWLRGRGMTARAVAVASLAGMGVLHAPSLGRHDWVESELREEAGVIDYVSIQARDHTPSLVVGTRAAWPQPAVVDWNLVAEGLLPVTAAGSAMDPRQEHRLAKAFAQLPLPESLRASSRRVLGRYHAPSMIRSLHAGDRIPDEDAARFEAVLETVIASQSPDAIIVLAGISDETRYTIDFIAPAIVRNGFREVSVREFPRAGTRVYVFLRSGTASPRSGGRAPDRPSMGSAILVEIHGVGAAAARQGA